MKETGVFFLYLFACLVLGALLTYPLMQTGWIEQSPHRVMGRLSQVFILLGLWPFLRAMGLATRPALGYAAPTAVLFRSAGLGWVAGAAILMALACALIALQVRVPDDLGADWPRQLIGKAIRVLLGGILIGLLEETFFRGLLYAAVHRRAGTASAIFWTAFLYALLHFMKPHSLPDGVAFDWAGAWQMFLHVFTGVFQWKHVDSMTALFLVGIFLGLVRAGTGHIGWCIGLHAGWVFVIQVTRHLTDGNESSPHAYLAGSYDGTIGWLAAAWLGLLSLGYWYLSRRWGGRGARGGGRNRAASTAPPDS